MKLKYTELYKRITSESPKLFKKILGFGIAGGAIGAAVVALPESVAIVPKWLKVVGNDLIVAGVVAAAISKLTVADSAVLKKSEDGNTNDKP